ncbi:hypothetical protein ACFYO2_21295 [Streptomyces sp. NPDC006602]|uniref:hypothetical protein n=1 Tax=Streptomyces sp. NPDC006602 TaxID=3364751 RepID=UPI0036842DB6
MIGSILCFFGVLGLVGGGALVANEYSNGQQTIANVEYGEVIWSDEPAESIFPDTVGGGDFANPKYASWRRLGISPDTSCSRGLTGKTLAIAERVGCKAVLRATYVDPTGDMLATVALVVLPEDGSKRQELAEAYGDLEAEGTVAPLPVPGTLAAGWKGDGRSGVALRTTGGEHLPYAVAVTTGAVDGRRVAGNLPGAWGDELDVSEDRASWFGEAEILASLFQSHMDYLQLGGTR